MTKKTGAELIMARDIRCEECPFRDLCAIAYLPIVDEQCPVWFKRKTDLPEKLREVSGDKKRD